MTNRTASTPARRPVLRLATLMSLALAACTHDTAPQPPSFTVQDSAGVEIVINTGSPSPPFELSAEPVLRMGVVSGAHEFQFADINGLARLSDDRLVVLDGMAKELRFFSLDGEHLHSVGGEGLGPGEFRAAALLDVLPGDTLQVEDFPWRTRFAPDGTVLVKERVEWSRVRQLGEYYAECTGPQFIGDDIIACSGSVLLREGGEDVVPIRAHTYVHIPADFSRLDTLATVPRDGALAIMRRRSGGLVAVNTNASSPDIVFWIGGLVAYGPAGFFDFGGSPTRFATGTTDRYSIRIHDLDGTLRRIIRRTDGMRPPMPAEINPLINAQDAPPGVDVGQVRDADFSGFTPVDSLSLIRSVFLDDLNRIWAGIADPSLGDGAWHDVFDADGGYLGPVRFPDRFTPFQIGTDFVLGVRRDELNVEFVELYALTPTTNRS